MWKDRATSGAKPLVLSPADPNYNYNQVVEEHTTRKRLSKRGLVLRPGQFVLAWTRERVCLPRPARFAARVEGKSSLARLGIGVHVTAPTIHAGFQGQIQLEMRNNGVLHVRLLPGMRICQLIFEMSLGVPEKGYTGIFAGQSSQE